MVWFCWYVRTETHIFEAVLEDQQRLRAVAKDDKRDLMFNAFSAVSCPSPSKVCRACRLWRTC